VSSIGSFFSYINDARSHEPEVHIYVFVWFLVLHEHIVVGWSNHTHTCHIVLWLCSAILLIVLAFVDEILD